MRSRVERYQLFDAVASGGMGSVHLGRLVGDAGFVKCVAIKRMHAHHAIDQELVMMFIDEARLAARVRHPNVVPMLDVIRHGDELLLVMDFVVGATLAQVLAAARRAGEPLDRGIACAVIGDALLGLHAAHEARSEKGEPLCIIHRDISPQNIMVGRDGVARVLDFGIASAASRLRSTSDQAIRGKPEYLAPEQITRGPIDRRADVFATGAVLWEALAGQTLFAADNATQAIHQVLQAPIPKPSDVVEDVPAALDAVCLRALARDPAERFPSAEAMARALLQAWPAASTLDVADAMKQLVGDRLAGIERMVADVERREVDGALDATLLDAPARTIADATPRGLTRHDLAAELTEADDEAAASAEVDSGSSLSATAAQPATVRPTRPSPRAGVFRALMAALVLVVAGGFVAVITLRSDAGVRAHHGALDAAAGAASRHHVAPSASADPAPIPSASAASSSPPEVAPPPESAPAPRPAVAPKPPPPKANCNPPYWIDERGDRRFKPDCF